MSLNYKSIGKHIREIRQRNNLSQAMLSELVDKTPSYISYIESGIKSMSLDTFVLIANALEVSPRPVADGTAHLLGTVCQRGDHPASFRLHHL